MTRPASAISEFPHAIVDGHVVVYDGASGMPSLICPHAAKHGVYEVLPTTEWPPCWPTDDYGIPSRVQPPVCVAKDWFDDDPRIGAGGHPEAWSAVRSLPVEVGYWWDNPVDGDFHIVPVPASGPKPAASDPRGAPSGLSGVALIAAERHRQIHAEGYTAEHDSANTPLPGSGSTWWPPLVKAASAYLTPPELRIGSHVWPWHPSTFKPTPDDRARELVKAGALIAAELDRLQAGA